MNLGHRQASEEKRVEEQNWPILDMPNSNGIPSDETGNWRSMQTSSGIPKLTAPLIWTAGEEFTAAGRRRKGRRSEVGRPPESRSPERRLPVAGVDVAGRRSGGRRSPDHPLEVVETVLGVADVAWSAMEFSHNHLHHHQDQQSNDHPSSVSEEAEEKEIASLRSENQRLRSLLEENLKLFQNLSQSPSLSKDCPPDLYKRLVAAVDSTAFLTQLESLHQASLNASTNNFPFEEATEADLQSVKILVNGEPSWWVWVTDEKLSSCVEERSGIDDENYVVVNEEQVVEGVANFMAKCILSNPKAKKLSPEELQKTVASALGGVNKLEQMVNIWHAGKIFYALSTWGLALTGLYTHRAILKVAAKGIGASGKVIMMAL
ncbi:hypothetical protein BVC80_8137g9 [Macleaya cordata]|uniref:Uncharacterized protein n=1 Tax=Macleaya cordata TaxID=56857 RepID=A0A200PUZ8_MACCD|nr:hypothetical protein BVC80_8137g9 [Macleaya cordata]